MKTGREKKVTGARMRLDDQRLLAFLRACRGCDDILACKLVNDKIDEGKGLDESFYTRSEYRYGLAVKECEDGTFDISFGCQVAPTAGDGDTWRVQFSSDGQISEMQLEDGWIS